MTGKPRKSDTTFTSPLYDVARRRCRTPGCMKMIRQWSPVPGRVESSVQWGKLTVCHVCTAEALGGGAQCS